MKMIESAYLPEGDLIFTDRNRAYTSSLEGLETAMREGIILEGVAHRCSGDLKLTVELGGFTGEIERGETLWTSGEPIKDIAIITRVGKPVCFKVLSIEKDVNGEPLIRLSRREAQLECARNYLAGLVAGDVIAAKVTHLERFGAFVDIGCGVASLLSIDSISVSRINHPSDRLSVGAEMPVVVRSIERTGDMLWRIFVSRRELLGTWEENAALFAAGQTVTGVIRSVESYGVFVELTPNLAGLAEYRDDVAVGQTVAVYIKSIIPERMKIKLVIVDPYRGLSPRIQKYPGAALRTREESGGAREDFSADDTPNHIFRWKYSPECCPKIIESVFCAD